MYESDKMPLLPPVILEKKTELEFRRSFDVAFPNFVSDLRNDFPGLTSSQELVCMMIFLHKNADEIARALGISRDSVNKSRYRIRRRLGLPRETDLDTFICGRRQ